jgi:hypothetical protein
MRWTWREFSWSDSDSAPPLTTLPGLGGLRLSPMPGSGERLAEPDLSCEVGRPSSPPKSLFLGGRRVTAPLSFSALETQPICKRKRRARHVRDRHREACVDTRQRKRDISRLATANGTLPTEKRVTHKKTKGDTTNTRLHPKCQAHTRTRVSALDRLLPCALQRECSRTKNSCASVDLRPFFARRAYSLIHDRLS